MTQFQKTIPARKSRWTKPKPIWSKEDWNATYDALQLALDALGAGPDHTDRDFARVNAAYALTKLKRAEARQRKAEARQRKAEARA